MGRPQKFDDQQILDAALAVVGREGSAVTVAQVAEELGGVVGSIYYRFASRDVLLIRLWMRSVRRFQAEFLAACALPDPDAAIVRAACTIPEYCARFPEEARALTLYRHARLLKSCPEEVRAEVAVLNDDVAEVAAGLVERRFGRRDPALAALLTTAMRQLPYGLVRPYIGGPEPIPDWLTDVVAATVPAAVALGDTWPR